MQDILSDFLLDLDDIVGVIELHARLEELKGLTPVDLDEPVGELQRQVVAIFEKYKENTKGIKKVPGSFIPYIAGRFENFVKTIFEETATQVAKIHSEFNKLPSDFKNSLIVDTSKVIADPRKFQHGEGARDSFIKNLHNNIHNNDLSTINYQCISTTDRNMRESTFTELFKKISYKNIWDDISSQANIRMYFQGQNTDKTRKECQKKLNEFMDSRNSIAHPSNDVTWQSINDLKNTIIFIKEFSTALANVCPIFVKQKEREQALNCN